MAHRAQQIFIAKTHAKYIMNFNDSKVLEIGSLNINGSVREYFTNCTYTGIDVGEGMGVDIVCEGQKFDDPDASYDTVISAECFEHNPYWSETFTNMIRLCKSGGLIIITCATTGRPEHGTMLHDADSSRLTVAKAWDYYHNLTELDFRGLDLDLDDVFTSYEFSVDIYAHDLYFVGVKK